MNGRQRDDTTIFQRSFGFVEAADVLAGHKHVRHSGLFLRIGGDTKMRTKENSKKESGRRTVRASSSF
jgi:hypothetical protein